VKAPARLEDPGSLCRSWHADPGFTLKIYTHLLPTSEDRTRRAIDQAIKDNPNRMTAWRRPDHEL
jgi:hypothetical protein